MGRVPRGLGSRSDWMKTGQTGLGGGWASGAPLLLMSGWRRALLP